MNGQHSIDFELNRLAIISSLPTTIKANIIGTYDDVSIDLSIYDEKKRKK